ncbi:MAG: hypothetical protein ACKOQ4_11205 [Mycobacterium sp.]
MRRIRTAAAVVVATLLVGVPGAAQADPPPADPAADSPAEPAAGPAVPFLLPAGQVDVNPVQAITGYLTQLPGPVAAPAPAGAPGSDPLAAVGLLMPQNFGMPDEDQISPYTLSPNTPSGFARVDAYQGVHALLHSGLGRMPRDQLGQPLPGTAPPPGTALPPGLAQFYQDPAAVPPPVLIPPAG